MRGSAGTLFILCYCCTKYFINDSFLVVCMNNIIFFSSAVTNILLCFMFVRVSVFAAKWRNLFPDISWLVPMENGKEM
jgi:hypothetical protein